MQLTSMLGCKKILGGSIAMDLHARLSRNEKDWALEMAFM